MKLVALTLLAVGMFSSSELAIAQGPVPFKALMQETGVQPAIPPKPEAKDGSIQSSATKPTKGKKTERVTGGVLFGAGVASITATLVVVGLAHGTAGHPGRVWAGIGGGAAMTGAGVTLMVLGKRPSN